MVDKIFSEKVMLLLICINAIILFLISFDGIGAKYYFLNYIDICISLYFLLEMIYHIRVLGWSVYKKDFWNKLDVAINIAVLPSFALLFLGENFDILFLTILRLGRLFKFFKLLQFIPNIEHLVNGISRAFRSLWFLLFTFIIYLFIASIISCFLYKGILPDHFGDPVKSLYSTFKIFTIEGWFEIPDLIAEKTSDLVAFFSKLYFIFLLMSGGVFGLSLVNAIFVDELVADNNLELEKKIDELNKKIDQLISDKK